MDLDSGARIQNRYVIGTLLGSGGTALVYRAFDERLGISVAMKVLRVASPTVHARLEQEASIQASLRHPNIVAVTDLVQIDGWPALVMELVDGPALDTLLEAGKLPEYEALRLFCGILEGVGAAHARGLVHRDLKPANVMIARHGNRLLPKVADFGLAKALAGPGSGTRTGSIMGTPRYMAPEQIHDSKDVDERADIFSLGSILYELLVGRAAFDEADTLMVFNRVVMGQYGPIPDTIPRHLRELLKDALQIERDDRIPTVAAFLDRLSPLQSPTPSADVLERWGSTESVELHPHHSAIPSQSGATWTESVVLPPSQSVVLPPKASARRPWALGLVAALALAGSAAWQLRPPPVPPSFTAGTVPALSDSEAIQSLLGLAWQATEHMDDRSLEYVDAALDQGAQDPAVALLGAVLHMSETQAFADYLQGGFDEARGKKGPVPELLVALHEGQTLQEDYDWLEPTLREHLAKWPDDRLALTFLGNAMGARPNDVALDITVLDRIVEQAPNHVLSHWIHVRALRGHGEFAAAEEAGQAAIASGKITASLHGDLAVNAQQMGDHRKAIEHASAALQLDAGHWPARLHGAMSAAHLGDEANFKRLTEPMRGIEAPVAHRRRFAFFVARGLATLGRLGESAEWAEISAAACLETDAQEQLLELRAMQVTMSLYSWIADNDVLRTHLGNLDRAAADPSLPAVARREPGLLSVLAHGILAARAGNSQEVNRATTRLADDDAQRLAAEVAAYQQDRVGLNAAEGCAPRVVAATALSDLGHADEAIAQADAMDCPHTDSQPFALAHAVRAHHLVEGARDQFIGTWPSADPDLPASHRIPPPDRQ